MFSLVMKRLLNAARMNLSLVSKRAFFIEHAIINFIIAGKTHISVTFISYIY